MKRMESNSPELGLLAVHPPLASTCCSAATGPVDLEAFGNLRRCVGFLLGHVAEELDVEDVEVTDPRFPLTVAVHAPRS